MNASPGKSHWDKVYSTKGESGVSWFEDSPAISFDFIKGANAGSRAAIVGIGGGASRLAGVLLGCRFEDVTVLDLSDAARLSVITNDRQPANSFRPVQRRAALSACDLHSHWWY